MPIVFCASLVPCESENRRAGGELAEPEPARDHARRLAPDDPVGDEDREARGDAAPAPGRPARARRPSRRCPSQSTPWRPRRRASRRPCRRSGRARTTTAARSHHVSRFQAIAPIRPAKTSASVTTSASTMPLAIVAATASDRNAPTKFRIAAMITATRGDIARVETDVAIEFAVSWKPLVKSKASAVADDDPENERPSASRYRFLMMMPSSVLHGLLRRVDRLLEALEDVLPADHHHRVDPVVEQRRDRLAVDPVALVLEPVDLDRVVRGCP